MKVVKGVKKGTCVYKDITCGESFCREEQGDAVFIKTDQTGVSGRLCVNVASGTTYSFTDETKVYRVDARVVVNG